MGLYPQLNANDSDMNFKLTSHKCGLLIWFKAGRGGQII